MGACRPRSIGNWSHRDLPNLLGSWGQHLSSEERIGEAEKPSDGLLRLIRPQLVIFAQSVCGIRVTAFCEMGRWVFRSQLNDEKSIPATGFVQSATVCLKPPSPSQRGQPNADSWHRLRGCVATRQTGHSLHAQNMENVRLRIELPVASRLRKLAVCSEVMQCQSPNIA